MGLETAAFIGLSVFSGMQQVSAAKKEAKATISEGNIALKNKAKEVAQKAAAQRTSFLNSGLTLEGTPDNIISATFNTGLEDLNLMSSNYNTKAKSQISAGRSAALSSYASAFSSTALPSFQGSGFSANSIGQSIGDVWSSSPTGPYQPLGGY
jgi:hypothetical protein